MTDHAAHAEVGIMPSVKSWAVDELAASKLLAELNIEPTEEQRSCVARHFAQHRRDLSRWVAEQAQSKMIERLEAISGQSFGRESDQWAQGYCYAEQKILTMSPEELLDLEADQARSKGQILRSMIRQARANPS
jgi:hypothetical protein